MPTQYLLGLFMIFLSGTVDGLLQSEDGPQVVPLTVVFFMLAFLAATQVAPRAERRLCRRPVLIGSAPPQDIAVDGWALTMLSRRNVGYASTCNSVGQTAGYFMGNVLFLALESADFCNKYLRAEPRDVGVVTLSGRERRQQGGTPREQLLSPGFLLSSLLQTSCSSGGWCSWCPPPWSPS